MLTRVPDYYEAFHCLAGACPHTCCEKWEVVVLSLIHISEPTRP